ncbi:MAG: methyltransferase [Piscinibacter sp.]|uniref:methyltransferase n=1 Tax=Piscinibacter sp. TaxID=1903157 RepID=UPI003D0B78AA
MAGAAELLVPAAGAALVLAGLGWSAWAAWCLVRAPVALTPAGGLRVLVDHGPFAVGRHPIYLGALLALLGAALAAASIAALLAVAVLFAALHGHVVPREEAQLRRQYGGWYSDYAAETPRWF